MPDRRSFIAGMLATGLAPQTTWAEAGSPSFLSAGKKPDGSYVLCGLTQDAQIVFELQLPARGHAATAHPVLAEAVAFARRPGIFAVVLDCVTGKQKAQLTAPEGRHFYGHGTYSHDGKYLFTTENDFEKGQGVVGVWDVSQGYRRRREFYSGGVGPHDIKIKPNEDTLIIANGGIETHPDTGRAKLNLPSMRSNLSYVNFEGMVDAKLVLDQEHQKNSIRHLAVARDGTVAFAMQWQGDLTADLPLLGIHNDDTGFVQLASAASIRNMNGYLGSVAINGKAIATTSPRSGKLQVFHGKELFAEQTLDDVCGVASTVDGFFITTGTGSAHIMSQQTKQHAIAWDNHLIAI